VDWKIPLLKQLLPKEYKKELEMRFSMGEKNFEKMASNIVGHSNGERVQVQRLKHANDMDVDNLEAAKQQQEEYEYTKYVAELEAYYYGGDAEEQVDWLGKGKGAGKRQRKKGGDGKGKKGWQGAGAKGAKGDGEDGKGYGSETRKCHWCQKPGHLKMACRSFLAGKPKVIASIETPPGDWGEDEHGGALDSDEDVTPLDVESDGEESEGWEPEEESDDDEDIDFDGLMQTPEVAKTTSIVRNVIRSPLIAKAGSLVGSPLGTTAGQSMTESIRKGQLEIRELLLKVSPTSISTSTTPSTSITTSFPIPSLPPPGISMSKSQKKKRKKVTKSSIRVLVRMYHM